MPLKKYGELGSLLYQLQCATIFYQNLERSLWHEGSMALSKHVIHYDSRSGFLYYNRLNTLNQSINLYYNLTTPLSATDFLLFFIILAFYFQDFFLPKFFLRRFVVSVDGTELYNINRG